MPEHVIERLKPLFEEAREAFLSDPSYAFEIAKQGSQLRERRQSSGTVADATEDDV